jgi:hypothetical protein
MQILIAFGDKYRVYSEALAGAIQQHRPHIEAVNAGLEELEQEVSRLNPCLLICSRLPIRHSNSTSSSWIELSVEPDHLSRIRVGERSWEVLNPTLEDLLSVVDEAERIVSRL